MLTVDNDQPAWYAYLDHVAGVVPDKNGAQAGISALCHGQPLRLCNSRSTARLHNAQRGYDKTLWRRYRQKTRLCR